MNNSKKLFHYNTLKELKIKKDNKKNHDRKEKIILRNNIDKKEIDKLITHKKVDLRNQTYKRNEHLINESKFSGKDLFSIENLKYSEDYYLNNIFFQKKFLHLNYGHYFYMFDFLNQFFYE